MQVLPFDAAATLSRTVLSDAPALLLVLFFLIRGSRPGLRGISRPCIKDGIAAAAAFAGLIIAASLSGWLGDLFPGCDAGSALEAPRTVPAWLAVILACALTGYLEESFFRAYMLTRLSDAGLGGARAVFMSVTLFSICHLYEGPWGVVNAALAGSVLSAAYLYRRSLHGPAWAHAVYNLFVYVSAVRSFL